MFWADAVLSLLLVRFILEGTELRMSKSCWDGIFQLFKEESGAEQQRKVRDVDARILFVEATVLYIVVQYSTCPAVLKRQCWSERAGVIDVVFHSRFIFTFVAVRRVTSTNDG